ncbi:MAG: aromatic ring-hydroxylating dioxygenase subunit alpha, partial [Alphaproteobacteria bacterium]|nr:aromatic ring-hydroxylating dioxygenase subunit alpha [Alphaproteobacteria bacterium]
MAAPTTLATPPTYLGLKRLEPTLPSGFYVDPVHYERELRALWYRNWIYLCRGSVLAAPRSFRTFTIGTQSILVVRNDQGQLRAFHNTCRHRGSALCAGQDGESGKLRGKYLVCPYHGWGYDLDGGLAVVPGIDIPAEFDRSQYTLYDVALAEWSGNVYVCLEAPPHDIGAAIRPDSDTLANWPMADL